MLLARIRTGLPAERDKIRELVDAFLSGRNQKTIDAYGADLADFATFLHP